MNSSISPGTLLNSLASSAVRRYLPDGPNSMTGSAAAPWLICSHGDSYRYSSFTSGCCYMSVSAIPAVGSPCSPLGLTVSGKMTADDPITFTDSVM